MLQLNFRSQMPHIIVCDKKMIYDLYPSSKISTYSAQGKGELSHSY